MDKFEVIGYSTAGVCVVATLVVFFLWIMPANNSIDGNLRAIEAEAKTLQRLTADNETALAAEKPADFDGILKLANQMLVTKEVEAAAKKARVTISSRTRELIARVVKNHEVEISELPVDRLRPAQKIRQDLQKLFDDNKVVFLDPKYYSLSADTATTVDEKQFRTFQLFQSVATHLLGAVTTVRMSRPVVDEASNNLTNTTETVTEKVSSVLQFVYYDKDQWSNLQKKYRDENARASRQGTATAEPDSSKALPYERTGFKIVFQTNPVNVGAALNSLEQVGGYLVTVKRMEVIRAGNPFFTLNDYQRDKPEIPLPYRDGNVQVTAEVELLGFTKGSADEMSKKLFVDTEN